MKIVEKKKEGNKAVVIVSIGKKKFKRVTWTVFGDGENARIIEWRRAKTDHQVKKEQYELLENKFNNRQSPAHLIFKKEEVRTPKRINRRKLEEGLILESDNCTAKLRGVKWLKGQTGWGLKESKEFADEVFARFRQTEKKEEFLTWNLPVGWTLGMLEKTSKKLSDSGRDKLTPVKWVNKTTGWGLRDSKTFVDYVFAKNNF